jgi:hypothetical protein
VKLNLLYGRDLTVPIQLTDTLPPTIFVTAAQATQDAAVLNQISTTFLLSVGGTAEQLDGLTIALAANEKVELPITSLDHDITVTGSIFDVDLANWPSQMILLRSVPTPPVDRPAPRSISPAPTG